MLFFGENEKTLENSRTLGIRTVAVVKQPFEIFKELTSISAFYSLDDDKKQIKFSIGDCHYSSVLANREVIIEDKKDGDHETIYYCCPKDVDLISKFIDPRLSLYESWIKNIHKEVYLKEMQKEFQQGTEEFNSFLCEVQEIIKNNQ